MTRTARQVGDLSRCTGRRRRDGSQAKSDRATSRRTERRNTSPPEETRHRHVDAEVSRRLAAQVQIDHLRRRLHTDQGRNRQRRRVHLERLVWFCRLPMETAAQDRCNRRRTRDIERCREGQHAEHDETESNESIDHGDDLLAYRALSMPGSSAEGIAAWPGNLGNLRTSGATC